VISVLKRILAPVLIGLGLTACSTGERVEEAAFETTPASRALSPSDEQPALAVATVASLISMDSLLVRDPARFKKAVCTDSNIYDLDFDGARYSLRAEPLSACVLFSDLSRFKSSGFCSDGRCGDTFVDHCSASQSQELIALFAKDQSLQRCWNIGQFPPTIFTVLTTRIGESCQAQTLVRTAGGWRLLNTIDGVFGTEKTATGEGRGCWFDAGSAQSFEGDWFVREQKVLPMMIFEKSGGTYALLKTTWSGSDNYQLFRIDGERAIEVESFAESFKEPLSDPFLPIEPIAVPEAKAHKAKDKTIKGSDDAGASAPLPASSPSQESVQDLESTRADEATSPPENLPVIPAEKAPDSSEETGVNPLEGEQ
jgi:hypothetical protein